MLVCRYYERKLAKCSLSLSMIPSGFVGKTSTLKGAFSLAMLTMNSNCSVRSKCLRKPPPILIASHCLLVTISDHSFRQSTVVSGSKVHMCKESPSTASAFFCSCPMRCVEFCGLSSWRLKKAEFGSSPAARTNFCSFVYDMIRKVA